MDSLRPQYLRSLIGLATLSMALAAFAAPCAAQDGRDESAQGDPGYRGPFLSWAGKTAASSPAPAEPEAPPGDLPPPSAAPDPAPQRIAVAPLPPPAPPPAAYAPDVRPAPPVAMSAPPPAPASPPPVQLAQAAPPAATASASPHVSARYYSLHREYGMTPDPVTLPADRPMVLVGPPDNPPAQPSDGAASDGAPSDGQDDASDTPAHHPNGQDPN